MLLAMWSTYCCSKYMLGVHDGVAIGISSCWHAGGMQSHADKYQLEPAAMASIWVYGAAF